MSKSYVFVPRYKGEESDLDEQIRGFHDALRRVPLNPNETANYRAGYCKQKSGYALSDRVLRYMMAP